MANQHHLNLLRQGRVTWNTWREAHAEVKIDLSRAKLDSEDLHGFNLSDAYLSGAYFSGTHLEEANLSGAFLNRTKLDNAFLKNANLSGTHLKDTNLCKADLRDASLRNADLSGAHLRFANLSGAILVGADLRNADLNNCLVYGVSAWDVNLEGAKQKDLVITLPSQPTITIDNLKLAQFIYLLLNNAEIRDVIDTVVRKAVLILGRFTPQRKAVLDALKQALRTHGYVPVLFDFDKPSSRDLTETVSTIAHLARFIIVDLTDPGSAPHEVATVIPYTVVPVQPLLSREPLIIEGKVAEQREYAMFQDLRRRYHWVLPTHYYTNQAHLLAALKENIIEPAERKAQELEKQ